MRQYDICLNANVANRKQVPYFIVLQSDLLADFATVVVAPIKLEAIATKTNKLNPVIVIEGKTYRAIMIELAGVSRKQLGEVVFNIAERHEEFVAAIDLLFTGI